MSFLIATPEIVSAAATDLAGIATTLGSASSAAAAATTGVLPAAGDEVSAAIAALFGAHGQAFQAASAQAAAFHKEFVGLLGAGANVYANAEANVVQTLTGAAATSAQGVNPLVPVFTNIEAAQIAYNTGLVNGELGVNGRVVNFETGIDQALGGNFLNGALNRTFNALNLAFLNTPEEFVNSLSGALVPANFNSSLLHGTGAQVFNGGQIGGPLGVIDQTVVAGLDVIGAPFQGTPLAFDPNSLLKGVETAQINYNTGLVGGELGVNGMVVNFETGIDQALGGNFLNGALNRTFNALNLAFLNTPEEFVNGLSGALVPANFNSSLLHGSTAQVFNGGQIGGPLGVIDQTAVAVGDLVGIPFQAPPA